jgi:hypothetical protein
MTMISDRYKSKSSHFNVMSAEPDFEWPTQTSPELLRRIHSGRMQSINTHAAAARQSARTMVNRSDTQAMAEQAAGLQSAIRQHRAPTAAIAHYLWSRGAIGDAEAATMEESVDIFVRNMKQRHWMHDYVPRQLGAVDIPPDLASPAIVPRAPNTPRKITRAFDCVGHFGERQQPLGVALPDIEATRRFRQFVNERCERKPELLERTQIQQQPEQPHRRAARTGRPRPPLYVK